MVSLYGRTVIPMPHKIVMNSGRTYLIDDYEEKKYKSGWIYFYDEYDDTIIGFRKDLVEAEVWQEDGWEMERVNNNGN